MPPPSNNDQPVTRLYAELGRTLASWGAVEHALAGLFCRCVNFNDPTPAVHAFWAVASFEAKLKMAHAAITVNLAPHPDLLAKWGTLYNRLSSKNQTRNKLAHGTVRTTHMHDKKGKRFSDTYFSPYGFKVIDTYKPKAEIVRDRAYLDTRPKDRMYINEIKGFKSSLENTKNDLWELSDAIFHLKTQQARLEKEALEAEILERHRRQANQTQQDTEHPPESSQE